MSDSSKQEELERRQAYDYLAGAERNPELVSLIAANKATEKGNYDLERKDILALSIAMLQTVFSPLLILIVLLIGFTLFFRILQIFLLGG